MNSDSKKPKQKSVNLTKADELRRWVRFVYEAHHELCMRKAWLLWHIADFRTEVIELAQGLREPPLRNLHRWLDVYMIARLDPLNDHPKVREFLERYQLMCLRYKPLEYKAHDVIKLLEEADQAGWGLNVENFLRDRFWYELREAWAVLAESEKLSPAHYLAGLRHWRLAPEEEHKLQKVFAQKKLRYKQVAQYTSVYFPTEVDRLVLHHLKQRHNKIKKQRGRCASCLLDQVDSSEKLRNYKEKDEPAEIRDSLLLYKLGLFRIVKATQTDEIYTPQIQCFPCSAETPKRLIAGELYYVRYDDRRIHVPELGAPFVPEPEPQENRKKIGYREAFLEERKIYMEASGFSDLDHAIRAAVDRIEKMLAKVKHRYWQK